MSFRLTSLLTDNRITKTLLAASVMSGVILAPVVFPAQTGSPKAAAVTASQTHNTVDEQQRTTPRMTKEDVKAIAAVTLEQAQTVLSQVKTKTDPAALTTAIAALDDYPTLDVKTVRQRTTTTATAMSAATAAATKHDQQVAAAAAAAAAQARAVAAAQARAAANTPDGARSTARALAESDYGWGDDQFQCLDSLWTKESGWSYTAYNDAGGATGIPQALPGDKMASAGEDWATNAATQIRWGLDYISRSYGSPCSAWSHSESSNWY